MCYFMKFNWSSTTPPSWSGSQILCTLGVIKLYYFIVNNGENTSEISSYHTKRELLQHGQGRNKYIELKMNKIMEVYWYWWHLSSYTRGWENTISHYAHFNILWNWYLSFTHWWNGRCHFTHDHTCLQLLIIIRG